MKRDRGAFLVVLAGLLAFPVQAQLSICLLKLASYQQHMKYGAAGLTSAQTRKILDRLPLRPLWLFTQNNLAPAVEQPILEYARKKLGLENLQLMLPKTVPTSGALIYLIRHNGESVAAFKIFVGDPQALTRELAGVHILEKANLPNVKPVEILDAGWVELNGRVEAALLMKATKGQDSEQRLRELMESSRSWEALKEYVVGVARAKATMHMYFRSAQWDAAGALQERQHEAGRLRDLIRPEGSFIRYTAQQWMTGTEFERAKIALEKVEADFLASPVPFLSIGQGDAHAGNFSYDTQTGILEVIDLQTMLWSVDRSGYPQVRGYLEPGSDIGLFLGSMEVIALNSGLTESQMAELGELFLNAYAETSGVSRAELERNLPFFLYRFARNILHSPQNRKDSEETRRRVLDRLLKRLGARGESVEKDRPVFGVDPSRLDRGAEEAYQRYFSGMDSTARTKVALGTTHFPSSGKIVDMGSGSGQTTSDLASLFPHIQVVGVDLNPTSVAYARGKYQRENLSFLLADITSRIFEPYSVDCFLNSSIFHEVASFTGYDVGQVGRSLAQQATALNEGGTLVIRDFVAPEEGAKRVFLDLPNSNGSSFGEVQSLSTAALFERFARDFKSSRHRVGGVPFEKVRSPLSDHNRYALDHRTAVEFLLRKDYRRDEENWSKELEEEYLYWSQSEFEQQLRALGLRVLVSKPIFNPWIVKNRFEGKFLLSDEKDAPLPFPATNFLIVAEKIAPNRGIEFVERQRLAEPPQFLVMDHFSNRETGEVFDLVRRPDRSADVIPWFRQGNAIHIVSRRRYPRPILKAQDIGNNLNRSNTSGYISEPLTIGLGNQIASSQMIQRVLLEQAGIKAVKGIQRLSHYYPSPGGLGEWVDPYLVEVFPFEGAHRLPNERSGFSESGEAQSMSAQQLLRSYQVGGQYDSRLEINVYQLLLGLKEPLGPWIGAEIDLAEQENFSASVLPAAKALRPERRQMFEKTTKEGGFLEIRRSLFEEVNAGGEKLAATTLEYVLPTKVSRNSMGLLPIVRHRSRIYVGLELRDLPAPQFFEGSSSFITYPLWRIPKDRNHLHAAEAFVVSELKKHFNADALRIIPLGGEYFVSPGITPEVVYPYAVEVKGDKAKDSSLLWVALDELIAERALITDVHLLTAILRLHHATQETRH